jgi:hypothetical protein
MMGLSITRLHAPPLGVLCQAPGAPLAPGASGPPVYSSKFAVFAPR